MVRLNISDLNIRNGVGTNIAKAGQYTGVDSFTIVEVEDGKYFDKCWERLKSGAAELVWIIVLKFIYKND